MKSLNAKMANIIDEVRQKMKNERNLDPRIQLDAYHDGTMLVMFEGVRLSVNIPPYSQKMQPGVFAVKNWSENEDIAKRAEESGLFQCVGITLPTGHVNAPVWRIKNY